MEGECGVGMRYDDDFDEMECPTPCPRCGEVCEQSEMRNARTAESKTLQIAFRGKMLCPECHKVKKTGQVYLMGGFR